MNPQQQSGQKERKDPGSNPPKQAPGEGQAGKSGSDGPGTQPPDPADLGFDPKSDSVQARGTSGQSSEKSTR